MCIGNTSAPELRSLENGLTKDLSLDLQVLPVDDKVEYGTVVKPDQKFLIRGFDDKSSLTLEASI
jgi:hypothetical protein